MRLLLLIGLVATCRALYEDQIGKFDWRKQFVGCPTQVLFQKTDKTEQLIVSTKENVFAAISTANGDLNWRRIQEAHSAPLQLLSAGSKRLYTVSDGGRALRAWNAATGALLWQQALCDGIESPHSHLSVPQDPAQGVHVYSCGAVHLFSTSGELVHKTAVGNGPWTRLAAGKNELRLISLEKDVLTVKIIIEGKVANTMALTIKGASSEKCVFTSSRLVCFHSDEVTGANILAPSLMLENAKTGVAIRELIVLDSEHVAARSSDATVVLALSPMKELVKVTRKVESAALVEKKLVTVGAGTVTVYDLTTGKEVLSKPVQIAASVPVKQLAAHALKDSLELFVVYTDCRVEFFDLSLTAQALELEWVREEALARVAAVEMIDLPLSESQQLIEDEFDESGGNILTAFVHRTVSQLIQLQRWLLHTVQEVMTLSETVASKESFSQLISSVKANSKPTRKLALERDYFNLRKMLLIASLDGVVFGIDSSDGSVVWRNSLGVSFSPLKNSLAEEKMPLFVQRSTSNYHLNGQAAVVFRDSFTEKGVLFVFNPITGAVLEKKTLDSAVSRVDLLPFTVKDQIHPLIIIDSSEKISFYPAIPTDFSAPHPVFILSTGSSVLAGKRVDFKNRRLETVWTSNVHLTSSEKIILVKGKSSSQKVHSQGRVLIDRNVQYKYSNPNLVAVATLDSASQTLTVYLVDVVSGLIVHTAKLPRAMGPVHMVHCENWVAYSYWSEKTRRTELGVIELYEGETQNNKEKFDSLLPTAKAPEVTTQSYVYAQGVDAMAVSETEQGLTTRSIILALPFGGLHEVSRKLLDANRPYELTQEMREEGMIPYMPELPIATEEMINYNQTVFRVKGIKTAPSGLESTSLMLAYGIDIFFTRLHPSGTFDILKDDFDHVLISLVLAGLFLGSFISKRIARNNALKASWA